MTDPEMADATYIEPITPDIVEKIISLKDLMHYYQRWGANSFKHSFSA